MNSDVKKEKQLEVDVSPEMQIYRILQHLSYGVETALAELVDNAIQSHIEGRKRPNNGGLDKRLTICIEISGSTITLTDNAGGISLDSIQRALKPGFDSAHASDSLSVYGIGMKSAALWFSEDWNLKTSVPGEPYSLNFRFNLPNLLVNESHTEVVDIEDEAAERHYTIITLRNVTRNESKDYYEQTVIPYLLETFFRFSDLDLQVIYNGLHLTSDSKKILLVAPEPHIYPEVNSKGLIIGQIPVEWQIDLDFQYQNRRVKGFILLRETGGYGQPGIRLLRNDRVIQGTSVSPHVPASLLGTSNKYAAQRVYGELDLNEFPVDFMKTQFNDNLKPLFEEVNRRLSEEYHFNIIKQATGFRKRESVKPEIDEQARMIIAAMPKVRADTKELPVIPEGIKEIKKKTGQDGSASGIGTGEPVIEPAPISEPTTATTGGNTEPVVPPSSGGDGGRTRYEPLPENKVEYSQALYNALSRFEGDKLPGLYSSLCTISLKVHPVLCYVGAWSLLECWSSALGKSDGTDFVSFLNGRLGLYQPDRSKRGDIRQVFNDIQGRGNCSKHSGIYANTHALDLKNAFKILEPFILHQTNQYFDAKEAI
ncbi:MULTISPECIES: ATP-binding protein [Pectobacterium]|uniref:ATP-binding protein n=1 Tax=Pectobacterium TaxID=122277 RepID=UPI003019745E